MKPFDEKKNKYITQKLKDLREFGYPTLTRDEVEKELEAALKGEKLTVIGMFIQSDLEKAGLI